MRIDTSEPSLVALFEKGQVGMIRSEFMRLEDVIAGLITERDDLKEQLAVAEAKVAWLQKADRLVIWNGTEWQVRPEHGGKPL